MANQYTYGRTQRERILSRLLIDSESGCLLWTGFLDKDGYGRAWDGSSTRPVHRVVWEMLEGQIPSGMTLDHVKDRGCRYRHCASIAHLEVVTNRENVMRGDTIPAAHAAKTHCDSGHEFTKANTYWYRGKRECRSCRQVADRRYRQRKRAAA
jgi:hypothetical protein